MDTLTDPVVLRAALELALLGAAGGALGCWVLAWRLAYAGESLAHAMLPGLVGAALLGLPLLAGGIVGVGAGAVAIALAARIQGVERDTAVAVVVTGLLGLGSLLALAPSTPAGLSELLFGDPLGVSDADLVTAGGLLVLVVAALGVLHPRLLAAAFDPGGAGALGVSAARAQAAVLALLALTVSVTAPGLGNLLVIVVVAAPAATARHLARRMAPMMAVAALVAVLGAAGGLTLSALAGTAAGPSVAAVLVAVHLVARVATSPRAARRGARPAPATAGRPA